GEIVEKNSAFELIKNPKHPYTKALLGAIPRKNSKKLQNIKGTPSPIIEKIDGCLFHKRCEIADEFCAKNHPEFKEEIRCFKAI
ncbi:ABC transporter ATP-binding protein, partial [bacterium]|nr:ABC transporter ATP-binding protein [bacterium]